MKQKCIQLRCMALLAFFAICSLGYAQMPTGFPTMPNTGNPAADAATYEQAKTQWLANNPTVPVNTGGQVAAAPTEAQNALAEQQKTAQAATNGLSQADLAAKQLKALEAAFDQSHAEWSVNNVRLDQAYISVFTMARGQSVVTLSQATYNSFHNELKALIDANGALFNVTQ